MKAIRQQRPRQAHGFTLVELVLTMVIIAVLAALALPRFFGNHGFEERGFYDEVVAALRYAQKTAIAQRRRVCVTLATKSVSLKIASTFADTSCTVDLTGPNGIAPYTVSSAADAADPRYRNSDIQLSPAATIDFLPSGIPTSGGTFQITGTDGGSSTVTLEAGTGYAR